MCISNGIFIVKIIINKQISLLWPLLSIANCEFICISHKTYKQHISCALFRIHLLMYDLLKTAENKIARQLFLPVVFSIYSMFVAQTRQWHGYHKCFACNNNWFVCWFYSLLLYLRSFFFLFFLSHFQLITFCVSKSFIRISVLYLWTNVK